MGSIFIDLTKTFDTVNHDIYISSKLNYYYVCHESLPKLKDYFSERKQLICIDSQSFEELAITSKMPQGSIFGLLLFIIVNSVY